MEEHEPPSGLRSNCSICLGDLTQKDKVSALVCGHIYHHGCISQWIATKKQCPSCRRPVPKNGFVERLFFDVAGTEVVEAIEQIDYVEMSCKLTADLKIEKEKKLKVEEENTQLKNTVKALEKKVIREKSINEKEIPRLQATIQTMSISMEETNYIKNQLKLTQQKIKACEFYEILMKHTDAPDEKLSQFLKSSGGIQHEKFFELIKAQNRELIEHRRIAKEESMNLRTRNISLQSKLNESTKTIKNLKDEVLSLRDRANVNTPVNKRLRAVMAAETPAVAKRKSLGFDDTSDDYGDDWSYFQPVAKDEENVKKPETSQPGPSNISGDGEKFTFDVESDDEDTVFKRVKSTSQKENRKAAPVDDSFDDFTFDIAVPKNIIKRIETSESTTAIQKAPKPEKTLKRNLSQDSKISKNAVKAPPVKTARISSFFVRKTSSLKEEDFVTLD